MDTSTDRNPPADARPRAVVLVEGLSDLLALEVLARRRGRDLAGEGVRIVAMGGATNIGHYLDRYGPRGHGLKVAGLYDSAEERFFRQGLTQAGLGPPPSAAGPGLTECGFFVCTADLEDELIRAIGAEQVERLVEAAGELASRQPANSRRSAGCNASRPNASAPCTTNCAA
jgi:hypothetical protein